MAVSSGANATAAIVIGGKYQLVRELGRGGMGAVYEAVHLGTGRHVALKVIAGQSRGSEPDPEFVARFQREAHAASSVESRHIVQVFDAGIDEVGGNPYMVLELLSGMDVHALVRRRGPLPVDAALRIAAQACAGLQRAHGAGITHRDIKSANLFLARGEPGEVLLKILDFGLAKIRTVPGTERDPNLSLTRTGAVMGSPVYMSPEQATGAKQADARSDIWSLGAVLYEILCGRPPHSDCETLNSLIVAICTRPPRPLSELAPWVPAEIEAIVRTALTIDRDFRFQTAGDMRASIDRFLPQGAALDESVFGAAPATTAGFHGGRSAAIHPSAVASGASSRETPNAWTPTGAPTSAATASAWPATVAATSNPSTLAGRSASAVSEPRRRGVPHVLLGLAATVFVALGTGAFFLHRHGLHWTLPVPSSAAPSPRSAAAPGSAAPIATAPAGSEVVTLAPPPKDDVETPPRLPSPIGGPKASPPGTGARASRQLGASPVSPSTVSPSTPEWARCPHNIAVCMSECGQGNAASCYLLGAAKEGGENGAPPDYVQALRYYKQACAGSDSRGCAAATRIEAAKPSNAAYDRYELEQMKSQCEGARITLCVMLGATYEMGSLGVPKNLSLAMAAYKHGCDAGDSACCTRYQLLQSRVPAAP